MNIKGIGNINGVNAYKNNLIKKNEGINPIKERDRIEISQEGKALSNYSLDNSMFDNSKKIESIRERISQGTYNIDSKIVAESIVKEFEELRKNGR